eukprot:5894020-Prymnesium_polylepis.1
MVPRRAERAMWQCVCTRGCGDDDADHDRVAAGAEWITMVPKMKVPITIVLPLVPITMVPKMKVNEGCGCACIRE